LEHIDIFVNHLEVLFRSHYEQNAFHNQTEITVVSRTQYKG